MRYRVIRHHNSVTDETHFTAQYRKWGIWKTVVGEYERCGEDSYNPIYTKFDSATEAKQHLDKMIEKKRVGDAWRKQIWLEMDSKGNLDWIDQM